MIDTTLRRFASRPPLSSRTSAVKLRAAAASSAAGRAWSPVSLVTTIGRDSTATPSAAGDRAGCAGAAAQRHPRHRVAPGDHPPGRLRVQRRDAVEVRHEHHREQAARVRRHEVGVEGEQRIAGAHQVPRLRQRREPLALEVHGVETDVDEDLEPRRREGERVAGAVHLEHARVARRQHAVAQRIDRDPVAGEPLRERGVWDVLERDHHARERRGEGERRVRSRRRRSRPVLGVAGGTEELQRAVVARDDDQVAALPVA
jgi:hypothetical protein